MRQAHRDADVARESGRGRRIKSCFDWHALMVFARLAVRATRRSRCVMGRAMRQALGATARRPKRIIGRLRTMRSNRAGRRGGARRSVRPMACARRNAAAGNRAARPRRREDRVRGRGHTTRTSRRGPSACRGRPRRAALPAPIRSPTAKGAGRRSATTRWNRRSFVRPPKQGRPSPAAPFGRQGRSGAARDSVTLPDVGAGGGSNLGSVSSIVTGCAQGLENGMCPSPLIPRTPIMGTRTGRRVRLGATCRRPVSKPPRRL